jgi:hypothetical protein
MRTLHPRPPQEATRVGDSTESDSISQSRLYLVPAGFVLHITHAWASIALNPLSEATAPPANAQASVIAPGSPQNVVVRATAKVQSAGATLIPLTSSNAVSLSDLDVIEPNVVLCATGSTPLNLPFYSACGWSGYLLPATAEDGGL